MTNLCPFFGFEIRTGGTDPTHRMRNDAMMSRDSNPQKPAAERPKP